MTVSIPPAPPDCARLSQKMGRLNSLKAFTNSILEKLMKAVNVRLVNIIQGLFYIMQGNSH